MELQVNGGKAIEVSEATFGVPFNEPLIHQVVTVYLAGARSGTRAQKNRSQVAGGGAKPFRQKGTGRARQGSIRSPLWRGGGRAFPAVPKDHTQKLNKKMYKAAMQSMLSELVRLDRLIVVETLAVDAPRTRALLPKLEELGVQDALLVIEGFDEDFFLAARNLPTIEAIEVNEINPVSLLRHDKVVLTVAALRRLEETLG